MSKNNTAPFAETIKSWVNLYSDTMFTWALFKTNNKGYRISKQSLLVPGMPGERPAF